MTIKYDVFVYRFYPNIDHREHGNRIIHEKLTGSLLFEELIFDPDETE